MSLPGVVPTSLRRGRLCPIATPCAQPDIWPFPPSIPDNRSSSRHPIATVSNQGSVSLISLNCGGLGDKLPGLLALTDWLEPDVICLQELWETCELDDLKLPNFKLFCAGSRHRGGGLATLIHSRLLTGNESRVEEVNVLHAQLIRIRWPSGNHMSIFNLHLAPSMTVTGWAAVSQMVAKHLQFQGTHLLVVCGDFNENLAARNGRVYRCIRAGGLWASLFCPYPFGEPTNVVSRKNSVSCREIDYILLHRASPVENIRKLLYPGVSTHRAVFCTMDVKQELPLPQPYRARLQYSKALPADLKLLGSHARLCFWLATNQALLVDDSLRRFHSLASQVVPFRGSRASASEASSLRELQDKAAAGDPVARARLEEWFVQARDRSFRVGLGIRQQALSGVHVSSLTTKWLFGTRGSSRCVERISRDGVHFPSQPAEYLHEARLQAQEFYSSRRLRVDVAGLTLAAKVCTCHYADDPPFAVGVMSSLLRADSSPDRTLSEVILGSLPCGAPPTIDELMLLRSKHGSNATSLDDLPCAVVRAMPGIGISSLAAWLQRLRDGEQSQLLSAVIHLCLKKKEPSWLLRNSRPILLEPFVRRLESAAIFQRLMARAERDYWLDPWVFSYRKQVNPLYLALLVRWAIAYWALDLGCIHVSDWDESNAFCNLNRVDLQALLRDFPALDCGDWVDWFYSSFACYVQTPYGLAEPYAVRQGAAQGDSMGVGTYMLFRTLRGKALRTTVSGPVYPCLPDLEIPEVIFADDARQFGRTPEELGSTISAAAALTQDAGGSVNVEKLKVYSVAYLAGRLTYQTGEVPTTLGTLSTQRSGLSVVGVSVVMGEDVSPAVASIMLIAQTILRSVRHHRPTLILALRVALAYLASAIDYKLAIVPLNPLSLVTLQRCVRQICRAVLGVPSWFPSALLTVPLRFGGMGMPDLYVRLLYRRLLVTFQASQCRCILVRELVKGLVNHHIWERLPDADAPCFRSHMQARGFQLVLNPPTLLAPVEICKTLTPGAINALGPFLVVSDGSCRGHAVGYAAVLLNSGGVLATSFGASLVHDASSWCAEWLGRLLAVELTRDRPGAVCFVSDNTTVSMMTSHVKPSGSDVIDRIRAHVAASFADRRVLEGYIPAQHDTGWSTTVSQVQQCADTLAKQALSHDVVPASLPLLSIIAPHSLLLTSKGVCIRPAVVLSELCSLEMARPSSFLSISDMGYGGHVWETLVTENRVPSMTIRSAMWLRSATFFRSAVGGAFCPYCGLGVTDWMTHFTGECPRVVIATAAGFRALLRGMRALGWTPTVLSPWTARCQRDNSAPLEVAMGSEMTLFTAAAGTLCCSWSGLVWLQGSRGSENSIIPVQDLLGLTLAYLHVFQAFLERSDVVDAMVNDTTADLIDTVPLPWGITVLLTMVLVLSRAVACSGLALLGPPWQPADRDDVVLVWNDSVDNLPLHILRIHALSHAAQSSARQGLTQRLLLHPGLTLTWEGCGAPDSLKVLEAGVRTL